MEKKVMFSDPAEAIAKARRIFADNSEVEWVVCEGEMTVGGVFWEGSRGELVLHRSEMGAWTMGRTLEETKEEILRSITDTAPRI